MYSLPSDRIVTWQGNAGVQGGIPFNRVQFGNALSPGATVTQINQAITDANAQYVSDGIGRVVKLNHGIFNLAGVIVMKSGVTLRGHGRALVYNPNDSTFFVWRFELLYIRLYQIRRGIEKRKRSQWPYFPYKSIAPNV